MNNVKLTSHPRKAIYHVVFVKKLCTFLTGKQWLTCQAFGDNIDHMDVMETAMDLFPISKHHHVSNIFLLLEL
jgi:hypothetical protein